ncbi:unnamed protein product, partial [Oncorhynchus mykiss]
LPPKEQLELQASPDPDRGSGRDSERGEETFRDPGGDLFLWAILQNQKELAEIAWEQSRDCTSAALAASKILKKLAEEGAEEEDEAEEMRELAKHYERHAIGTVADTIVFTVLINHRYSSRHNSIYCPY